MTALILGGSKSGKSDYAQSLAQKMRSKDYPLYYLATMKPCDMEDINRIKAHRENRKNMGFTTLEFSTDILLACGKPPGTLLLDSLTAYLLNRLSATLKERTPTSLHRKDGEFPLGVGIEPHTSSGFSWAPFNKVPASNYQTGEISLSKEEIEAPLSSQQPKWEGSDLQALTDDIYTELLQLCQTHVHVIAVSDYLFSDSMIYEAETENYRRMLGKLHQKVAGCFDQVYLLSHSLPLLLKGVKNTGGIGV